MTDLAERRAFLLTYRKTGTVPDPEKHSTWLKDPDYASAFREITRELKHPLPEKQAKAPRQDKPKAKRGRPRKVPPPDPGPPAEPAMRTDRTGPAGPPEPQPAEPPRAEPAPVIREEVREGDRGHTRIYVREGQELEPPEQERPPRPAPEPDFVPTVEVSVKGDQDQRALIDEYGELDRRMQLRAMDHARYETLKRAIKGWFDGAPADADGTVEGDVYLLHLSARERERKIRDMRELVDTVGLDKVLELAAVSIGALENLIGKAAVARLTVDARTGSRRIKAIPKQAAGKALTNGAVSMERTEE